MTEVKEEYNFSDGVRGKYAGLTPKDKVEVDRFKAWLELDEGVKKLSQSLAMLSEEDQAEVLEWAEYLSGDASALSPDLRGIR